MGGGEGGLILVGYELPSAFRGGGEVLLELLEAGEDLGFLVLGCVAAFVFLGNAPV